MKNILLVLLLVGLGFPARAQIMDSGTGAPSSSVGNNGDLYHRTDVPSVYGPKAAGAWPSTFSYFVGQGCTTVYHIDKDCDGYGVGPTTITTDPNPVFGPDADDTDATVNTPASVLTKYGSINAFLTYLGFPTNRVYYIDANNGNDSNFSSHGCSYANPCADWGAVASTMNNGAGGTVIYLPGISTGINVCFPGPCYYPWASSSASPVVLMSYPGTMANFVASNAPVNGGGGSYNPSTNAIFDGFRLIASTPGAGGGINGAWLQNVTFENMELAGWVEGIETSAGGQNVTIKQNLFHDISEHAIYPTTADQDPATSVYSPTLLNCSAWTWQANGTKYNPNFNLVTSGNIFLFVGSGGWDAIHYNGEVCGGTITGNVLIGGGGTPITLQDGNQNVTISNNLIASNTAAGITINMYGCDSNDMGIQSSQIGTSCDSTYTGAEGTHYYPSDEWNNTIVNNTIWTGLNAPVSYFCPSGSCSVPYYGIDSADTSEGIPGLHSIKNTTIQNNIIVSFDGNGGGVYPQLYFGLNSYPDTNRITNNLFYNAYTGNSSAHAMITTANGNCSAASWYCAGATTGTYGSGSAFPGTYSFAAFQSYNTGSNTNELWGNPTFTDVQTSYSTTPNMFNFQLLPGSPAIGAGLASGAPSTDITGATRASTPSIGAYEYTAVTALTSLACTPTLVAAGASVSCMVSVPQPAVAGGAVIAISSSSSAVVAPASVTIAAGASSSTFTATVGSGSPGQTVVLTAAFNGATQTASLTFPAAAVTLSSLACTPSTIVSGAAATCTVTLSQPAGSAGITVNLSSDTASVTVPATVSVAASSTTAQFSATAGTVSNTQNATISAQYSGASVSATVSVQPPASTGTVTPLTNGTWTMVQFNGWPISVVGYDGLTYGSGGQFYMWNNYHNETSESNEAFLEYSFPYNRWDVLAMGGPMNDEDLPGSGHPVGDLVFNSSNNTLLEYCCWSGSDQYESANQMWWFDPIGLVGRNQQTPTRPGSMQENSAVWDATDGLYFIMNTGQGLWSYNPTTNAFTHLTPSGTKPVSAAGYFSGMAWDSANDSLYLFGGNSTNNLYQYSISGNSWTLLSPSGTPPSARQYAGFAYDSTNNIFLMVGGDASGTYLCDTWVYDPTANSWTKLTPATSPVCSAGNTTFSRLAYDADDNVFMLVWPGAGGYAGGTVNNTYQQYQNWFFRYGGTGNNVGYAGNPTYSPSPGSLNRNTTDWALQPVLAVNGSTLYASWIETGTPLENDAGYFPHIYAFQYSAGSWSAMGSTYAALDPENSGENESKDPTMAIVNGVPWLVWDKQSNSSMFEPDNLYAKSWSTSTSTWSGSYIPPITSGSGDTSGPASLIAIGSTPYVAFLEIARACSPYCNYLYVDSYNGSAWSQVGTGALNHGTQSSGNSPHAVSVSLATDGTNPYVAWTEFQANTSQEADGTPQVFVSEHVSGSWTALGGAISNTSNWAQSASIAYLSQPYVAYTERTQTGVSQVFVQTWSGSAWSLVGSGTLNKNISTGWAEYPYLFTDGTSLYCTWVEQEVLGQQMQVYVDKWNGSAWTPLGGSLNANIAYGSAEKPTAVVYNGQPVVAWGEVKYGSLRNVYVSQWNGTSWTFLAGAATTSPSTCDLNGDGVINSVDVQLAINQAIGLSPCTNADLQGNGQCTVVDVQRVINASLGGACLTGP